MAQQLLRDERRNSGENCITSITERKNRGAALRSCSSRLCRSSSSSGMASMLPTVLSMVNEDAGRSELGSARARAFFAPSSIVVVRRRLTHFQAFPYIEREQLFQSLEQTCL